MHSVILMALAGVICGVRLIPGSEKWHPIEAKSPIHRGSLIAATLLYSICAVLVYFDEIVLTLVFGLPALFLAVIGLGQVKPTKGNTN